ncbi:cation:proton antiporter [Bradyrhizobium sp. LHD-71]|uniref:cation:proton antiporter domain-containing protein n=1 Tax=Bradyrhizobium sp. LHD-71 TaxID=3072141 RepID=UPI00280F36C0|nr:cation:proton antiporter [Bradyrhizobium sp. LHD-71]MDQ8731812.1 cation:proton antiporter [Bradyrhizobium sp. LHD-71]
MEHVAWIKDFLVFLAVAGLAVPLLHRFGVSQVLSFLVLGIAVGPFGFGRLSRDLPWFSDLTLDDPERVAPFAELGIMALLFLIGLELSWSRLALLRKYVVLVGGAQFAMSAAAIGIGAALLGSGPAAATVIGLALAMSSTAVVMQIIESQGRTATHLGRVALSILLLQDLMVAPTLFLTGFLGAGGGTLAEFGWTLAKGVALIAAIVVIGRYALGSVFRMAAQTGSRELIMAISLLVLVGFSILTARAGLSAPLGAFLAGLILSETEYRHQIEIDLMPFKGLLVGLFFISVGMTVDLEFLFKWLPQILGVAVLVIAVKAVILWSAARAFGVDGAESTEIALLLSQAGEFGFVALAVAAAGRVIEPGPVQFLTATIALTMIVTPALAQAARQVGKRLEQKANHASPRDLPDDDGIADHAIIGGFGRVGQTIAGLLSAENVPYLALEVNAAVVEQQRKAGQPVYFGDASRAELLERAGAKRARVFIVTLDEVEPAERMIRAIREFRADAVVLARAVDHQSASRFIRLGAVEVVPETLEASLQLGGRALEMLGASEDAVARRLAVMREQFEEAIKKGATPH